MQLPVTFDETAFTQEELQIIEKCVQDGRLGNPKSSLEAITSLLEHDLTPHKEHELQKLHTELVPLNAGFEDKVKNALYELERDDSGIKTPEQEKVVQLFINKELSLIKTINVLRAKELEYSELLKAKKDDNSDLKDVLSDIKTNIKKFEEQYKNDFSVKTLKKSISDAIQEVLAIDEEEAKKIDVKPEVVVIEDNSLFFCTQCKHEHKRSSKKGQEHAEFEKKSKKSTPKLKKVDEVIEDVKADDDGVEKIKK